MPEVNTVGRRETSKAAPFSSALTVLKWPQNCNRASE